MSVGCDMVRLKCKLSWVLLFSLFWDLISMFINDISVDLCKFWLFKYCCSKLYNWDMWMFLVLGWFKFIVILIFVWLVNCLLCLFSMCRGIVMFCMFILLIIGSCVVECFLVILGSIVLEWLKLDKIIF